MAPIKGMLRTEDLEIKLGRKHHVRKNESVRPVWGGNHDSLGLRCLPVVHLDPMVPGAEEKNSPDDRDGRRQPSPPLGPGSRHLRRSADARERADEATEEEEDDESDGAERGHQSDDEEPELKRLVGVRG